MANPTLQEVLAAAKLESENNAALDINNWAFNNPTAHRALVDIWNKHLVLGHKALARMLLGKPPKAKKPDVPEEE